MEGDGDGREATTFTYQHTPGSEFGKPKALRTTEWPTENRFKWERVQKIWKQGDDDWILCIHEQAPDTIKHRVRALRCVIFVKIASLEDADARGSAARCAQDAHGLYIFSEKIVCQIVKMT